MFPPDPLEAVLRFLRDQPELNGVAVSADLTGHQTSTPQVWVQNAGGFRLVRDRFDRCDLAVSVYGPSKREASGLAYVVREVLLRRLPGHLAGLLTFTDVSETSSPRDFPDPESHEQRFLSLINVYYFLDDPGAA